MIAVSPPCCGTTIVGRIDVESEKSTKRHRLSRNGGARMSGRGTERERERELPLKNWDAGGRELGKGSDRGLSAFPTPSFSSFVLYLRPIT